jgi:hypothetical protein
MTQTLTIEASDTEAGLIVFTIREGERPISIIPLRGLAAQQFAEEFGRAYVTAFGDTVPAAVRDATQQDVDRLARVNRNGHSPLALCDRDPPPPFEN